MKKFVFTLALIAAVSCARESAVPPATVSHAYPIGPVPFTEVSVSEGFWGQRLQASREVTIPLAFSKCEETGRYDNFVDATRPDTTRRIGGRPFDDTDVYKTIEGASYSLQTYPDPVLEAYIDSVLVFVAAAQEPDGYLNTARSMNPLHPHDWMGPERWINVERASHELYNLGHMCEAAVAHYQATGKRDFLDIAIKYADCVCRNIGPGENQKHVVPGHEIAEMGLAKLYLVTSDQKYLDEARYFIENRGRTSIRNEYSQSHIPVLEQKEAVGHAVRAEYLYSGIADIAALTGEKKYIDAIDAIWNNMVYKKLYITGGVGSRYAGEAFGDDYELPNATSYCETCASIGNVYTNYRMFLLHGDSKYIDVLERTLYNALIDGVSIDGGEFFYPNPLESDGHFSRQAWFAISCCPSNVSRFIPSLPGYAYAAKDRNIYVNLFMSNVMRHRIDGKDVELEQVTDYPWKGDVKISVRRNRAGEFTLRLRIPGWAREEVLPGDLYSFASASDGKYSVEVNGEAVSGELKDGYVCITRKWKAGDTVHLGFDMEPRFVVANEAVEADRGRLAIVCGPLVYCAESVDNDGKDVREAAVSRNDRLSVEFHPELLNGTALVRVGGLTLIPYYAWCHRGQGTMEVWLRDADRTDSSQQI